MDHGLEFFRALIIEANIKCRENIHEHSFVMKNMKGNNKGLKKVTSYEGRHGKSEFYNPEEEAFSQTTVCLRPLAVLKTSNTVFCIRTFHPANNLFIK